MKPNFEAMTNTELKAYSLAHRGGDDDLEALRVLFNRRKSRCRNNYIPAAKE